ncbi:MAG: hypothetical protein N2Z72_00625 [Bacteroidales bacterium]|nr:hypothetical protein [Bacteroidales bacterium]
MKKIGGILLFFLLIARAQNIATSEEWYFYRVYHSIKLDSIKAMYLAKTVEKLGNALFAAFSPNHTYGYVVLKQNQNIDNVLDVVEAYKPEFVFLSHEAFAYEDHDILVLFFWRSGLFDENKWYKNKLTPIYYGPDRKKWDELYGKVLSIINKK